MKKVCESISKRDGMFVGYKDHYFKVGESGLKNIIAALKLANKTEPRSILDFASGYGRVLRHIKARFPKADITACELEKEAVNFCAKTFKVRGIYGDKDVKRVDIKDKFDLVWVGSLFTHLDKELWPETLKYLYEHINNEGILIFTVHGRYISKLMKSGHDYGIPKEKVPEVYENYMKSGFGYANYPDSKDYGISLSSDAWVSRRLSELGGLRILMFSERGWDNHQDVFACIKEIDV